MNTIELSLPIKVLFELMEAENSPYEETFDVSNKGIEIKTESGYSPILALVRKHSKTSDFIFDDGDSLVCANKHLVFENGECKTISSCTSVDTIHGSKKIVGQIDLGECDVYDVSIPSPHVYVTPSGIKHHNTSLALLMLKTLKVPSGDILHINASRERNPDVIADKIINFCTTWGLGEMKYVLLDEADKMTPLAQGILRAEMETYHESVRFILTANYPAKIIPALHSRCQGFVFSALDREDFFARAINILITEGVTIETDEHLTTVQEYVDTTYPDLRKCINSLQQNVNGSVLNPLVKEEVGGKEWYMEMAALFSMGRVTEARKLTIANVSSADEWDQMYRFVYDNLDQFGFTPDQQDEAIVRIAEAISSHNVVADPEINFAAFMIRLFRITKD